MSKFIGIENGSQTLFTAIAASTGATDSNKIIATNANGLIDESFLNSSSSTNSDAIECLCVENILSGQFVNIFSDAGVAKVRKSDNLNGKITNGFILENKETDELAIVYLKGENNGLSGLTPGEMYFTGVDGNPTLTPPYSNGSFVQKVGYAIDENTIKFANYKIVKISEAIGAVDNTNVVSIWSIAY
ncbi:hypothetical protein ELBI_96 [Anabaena phage Elbi]|nr:hypothetical protein ELBI_96 [Anabaena phage Elbi]